MNIDTAAHHSTYNALDVLVRPIGTKNSSEERSVIGISMKLLTNFDKIV